MKKHEAINMMGRWNHINPLRIVIAALILLGLGAGFAWSQATQEQTALSVNDYKIGARDLLQITVAEMADLNQTVRVNEDGTITMLQIGTVAVAGLSAQELEKKLVRILEDKYIKTPHVTVFIKEFQKVSVQGAVGKPGMYELAGPTNLLQVLSQAGGLTAMATNELYIFRKESDGGKKTITIDLVALNKGNQSLNIDLQPNDAIVAPIDQECTVFVYGEVKTPGAIKYKQSKKITLLQAIAQAGGPTEWAVRSAVVIQRKDPKTGKVFKIPANLRDIQNAKRDDIILEEGDVVIVP